MCAQSKHFLNDPSSLVLESLRGLCAFSPQLALDYSSKVIYLSSPDRSKVALLCGGGSGHEPAHSGFVGNGLLTGAVCGNVFASPSASQVRQAIELVDNEEGTLIIVKNYTGDVLNFGLAKEQYEALHPGKCDRVKFVIVGDDVAVGKTQGEIVGRRGLAGTVLVYKIAGALASRGASLDEVLGIAQWVSTRIGTVGVGLEHCHVPGTAAAKSYLAHDEIEIGMGIHGEPGHRRVSPVPPLNQLVPQLLELLTSTTDPERSFLPFQGNGKDSVILLINNLGGTSELELYGIVSEVHRFLGEMRISIERILCGTFMTSLNMPGFSITLLLLPSPDENCVFKSDVLLSLLDEETDAPGWKWSSRSTPAINTMVSSSAPLATRHQQSQKFSYSDPKLFIESIERASKALIAAEPEITRMDSIAGDGDCGLTLKSGATAVLAKVADGIIDGADIVGSIITIAQIAEKHMGGTSGALYSIFFSALAQGLQVNSPKPRSAGSDDQSATLPHSAWAHALTAALTKLYTYTRARPPSRTLVDPLSAFVSGMTQAQDFRAAVEAARRAAEHTRDVVARAGRSAYIEGDMLQRERIPDPGAWGVKTILESL